MFIGRLVDGFSILVKISRGYPLQILF